MAMTEVSFERIKGCLGLAGTAGPTAAVAFDQVWKPFPECTKNCEDVCTAVGLEELFKEAIRMIADTIAMCMIVFADTYTVIMFSNIEKTTRSKLKHAYYICLRRLREVGNQLNAMGAEPTSAYAHRSGKVRTARERVSKIIAPPGIEPPLPSLPLPLAIEQPLGIEASGSDLPHFTFYSF
jgi:hypothetical protein